MANIGRMGLVPLLLGAALAVGSSGCATDCLTAACPVQARPIQAERIQAAHRLFRALDRSPPSLHRAALERRIAPFLIDAPGGARGVDLARDYARWAERVTLLCRPVEHSAVTWARLHTIGTLRAGLSEPILLQVVNLGDEISDYVRLPGEVGPAPAASWLRALALALLGRLPDAHPDEKQALAIRFETAPDASLPELLAIEQFFEIHASSPERDRVIAAWLDDLPRRLRAAPGGDASRMSLEVALHRLSRLGRLAIGSPLAARVDALLQRVADRALDAPLARAVSGGEEDLARTAAAARWQLGHGASRLGGAEEIFPPARRPFRVWEDRLARTPIPLTQAGLEEAWKGYADDEGWFRREAKGPIPRCESRAWAFAAPTADAREQAFRDAAGIVFTGEGLLWNTYEARCLTARMLDAEYVAASSRAAFAARLLDTPGDRITRLDERGVERAAREPGPSLGDIAVHVRYDDALLLPTDFATAAQRALEDNPSWVEDSAEVRAVLMKRGQLSLDLRDPRLHVHPEITFSVGGAQWNEDWPRPPALLRAYHALFSLPDATEPPAPARAALLRHWTEILPAILRAHTRDSGTGDAFAGMHLGDFMAYLVLLATHAQRYGLSGEVARVFDEVDRAQAASPPNRWQVDRAVRLQRLRDLVRPLVAPESPVE